jgi:hypothetical protein
MEVLGFIESPVTATTAPRVISMAPPPTSVVADGAGPGPFDPFADWRPQEVPRRLGRTRVRWGLLVPGTLLLGVLIATAVWIYQRPQLEARQARTRLETAALTLQPGLTAFHELNQTLTEPIIDASQVNEVMLSLDDGVRRFFEAGADLNATEGSARARVLEISGDLSDAERLFTESYAYRSALIPILVSPLLETDPDLITLEEAADSFATWQTGFESTRTSLPEGVLQAVSLELGGLSADLDEIRAEYLDALGGADGAGADAAIERLGDELGRIEGLLSDGLEETQGQIALIIGDTLETLGNLPSLFG